MRTFFTAKDAHRLSGLSVNMIHYLAREGIVVPINAKHRRRGQPLKYRFGEVALLRAIAKMLSSGISPKKLKSAIERNRRLFASVLPKSQPAKYLLSDGKKIYFKSSGDLIVDITAGGQHAFGFMIDFEEMCSDIVSLEKAHEKDSRKLRSKKKAG